MLANTSMDRTGKTWPRDGTSLLLPPRGQLLPAAHLGR